MMMAGRERSTWPSLRWVVAVVALALAAAFLVLAVTLLALSGLCDSARLAAEAASCSRELVLQGVRAAVVAIPLGAVGALAVIWGR
jgi:hypothetical protein